MGSFGAILSWAKPIRELLSIPGYIDDSVSWAIILQAVGAVMSPVDWVLGLAGLACLVYAWWPEREPVEERKPVHHKVDAGGATWHFKVSQPTVTLRKASRYVRTKNWLKNRTSKLLRVLRG